MKNFPRLSCFFVFFLLHSLLYLLIRHEKFIHIQNVLLHSVTNLVLYYTINLNVEEQKAPKLTMTTNQQETRLLFPRHTV